MNGVEGSRHGDLSCSVGCSGESGRNDNGLNLSNRGQRTQYGPAVAGLLRGPVPQLLHWLRFDGALATKSYRLSSFCFPSPGYPGEYYTVITCSERRGACQSACPHAGDGITPPTTATHMYTASRQEHSCSASSSDSSASTRIPFMEVNVYTTHLVAQYQKYSQLGSYEVETYAAHRLSQIHSLASFIASTSRAGDALIITGDFNASPSSPEISLLLALCHRQGISLCRTVVPDDATNFHIPFKYVQPGFNGVFQS